MLNLWIRQDRFTTDIKPIKTKPLSTGGVGSIGNLVLHFVMAEYKLKAFI